MTDDPKGGAPGADESFSPEEKSQLDAKWAELEKMFKDRGVHDICLRTLTMLLTDDGQGFRDQWTPEIAADWWKQLDAARTASTHRKALDDLLLMAAFLHQKMHKNDLATGLVILINEAVLRYQLVDMDTKARFEQQSATVAATAVTGGKDRPIPAKVGDKPPEGALRPDQLGKGPRRI